jgi:uncharacterized protein
VDLEARIVQVNGKELHIPKGLVKGRYSLVNPDGTELRQDEPKVSALGDGGFGTVVRAVDELGIPRALKLVLNFDAGADDSVIAGGTSLFEREVRLSNAQPFKHVIPVMDYGTEKDSWGRDYGFFVSHFVEGFTLAAFVRELLDSADRIMAEQDVCDHVHDVSLGLINDLLKALVELDDARVVHMDLKPTNVLVHRSRMANGNCLGPGNSFKAFVIDLGAAKPIMDEMHGPTLLRWTPYWFPQYLLPRLQHGGTEVASGRILYEQLKVCWRQIDLFSCGRVLEWMFLDRNRRRTPSGPLREAFILAEEKKQSLWNVVFGDDFKVIEGTIDDLLAESPVFATANDAKLAFETIPLRGSRGILSSDTLTDRYPGTQFRTGQPLVRVSAPLDRIVAHPMFQRLRLIQQLSFVSEVFPDGTHNRFAHSLRTFDTAKQFVLGLQRRTVFRRLFQRQDVELLLAAALLHDVGQYPFAHTLEDLRKMGDYSADSDLSSIRHDQELTERVLNMSDDDLPSIATLLQGAGISSADLTYTILKSPKDENRPAALNITRDLISGVIDIDRVSYLIHDSDRTGVPYGRAIDVGTLVDALTVRWDRDLKGEDVGLGLEEHGVSAAEAVLTGVYWMYRNVYWVHNNRAFMSAIKFAFRHLLKARALSFDQYWEQTLRMSDWEALRFLSERYHAWAHESGVHGYNPLQNMVNQRRLGYERVFTLRCIPQDDEQLYNRLVETVSPEQEDDLIDAIAGFLPRSAQPQHGEILIDIPLKRRLRSAGAEDVKMDETAAERGTQARVWVCVRGPSTKEIKRWVDLMEYSPLAGKMGHVEDSIGRRIRVFFARSLIQRLTVPRDLAYIEDHLLEALRATSQKFRAVTRDTTTR